MKARDVMTSKVVSAHAETRARDVARLLLENHISAVPILDNNGAPVGMVSEGDLIGRDETEREERRDWWIALLAEGKSLSREFLSAFPERSASDIMSKPVVTVDEDADTGEIARLLQAYRIKRVPVVRDGRVVGIISRENLLRILVNEEAHHIVKPRAGALAGALAALDRHFEHPHHEAEPHAAPVPQPDDTRLTVADFRRLVVDYERKVQTSETLIEVAMIRLLVARLGCRF